MAQELKVAVIGLDTSHSIEYPKRMQAPDCPAEQRVEGARAITCLRFVTPFQNEEGLDARQKQLEEWGVKVTNDFDEAIDGCDAIMLEINDAAYHLEYFARCADLGKPIFLDKPLADNIANGRAIFEMAKSKGTRVFSSSSLRYVPELLDACEAMPSPRIASVYGPLGIAPAGSSIVWYGVHAFEMLQRAMGRGARSVFAREDAAGVVATVEYDEKRRGVVELTTGAYCYGGCLRDSGKSVPYTVDMSSHYAKALAEIVKFWQGGDAPAELEDALEVMGMLDAAQRSVHSGKPEGWTLPEN